ncbi:MAG TPA: alpha/beta hydrolase [Candidatus Cybelea sp.]|nr:alpha/beta hydrolase [Candidatus Cybelea sp.]
MSSPTSISHRQIKVNGIDMHVAEQGKGPLVLMVHGWPELWYSWRHQIPAVAAAGFHAVAPDMRGYGRTEAPHDIGAYSIMHLVGDVVALVQALGEREAIIVGHDWGATVAWSSLMMRPDIFRAGAVMSVPYRQRGPAPPLKIVRDAGLHTFYWIYFQEPGVAEAEFERDAAGTFRRLLAPKIDPASKRTSALVLEPGRGFLDGIAASDKLPDWVTESDLALMAGEFKRSGFRGGLNWYRNIDRNWELTAPWAGATIAQPTLFIAGTKDAVIRNPAGEASLKAMPQTVPGLKRQVLIEGGGHWIQQERPAEVNAALIPFLKDFAR